MTIFSKQAYELAEAINTLAFSAADTTRSAAFHGLAAALEPLFARPEPQVSATRDAFNRANATIIEQIFLALGVSSRAEALAEIERLQHAEKQVSTRDKADEQETRHAMCRALHMHDSNRWPVLIRVAEENRVQLEESRARIAAITTLLEETPT